MKCNAVPDALRSPAIAATQLTPTVAADALTRSTHITNGIYKTGLYANLSSRSKKVAAEALLSRIDEPSVREKVVESLIAANLVDVERRLSVPTQPESPSASFYPGRSRRLEDELSTYESCSLVSPLETMTVAVTAHTKSNSRHRPEPSIYGHGQFSKTAVDHLIDKQLVDYFCKCICIIFHCSICSLV